MKKILKNLMFGLTVVTGAIFASCSTTDEVMDTIPYNRVLTPLNFKAEVVPSTGTDVSFRWDAMQNAEAYELQIFEAAAEPDYDSATPLDTFTVESSEIPYLVALEVDKTYFARVRGISSKVEASHWAYPEKENRDIKTYAVRPSLNPVVVTRTTSTVSIKWDDASDKGDVTLVRVAPVLDSKTTVDYDLSSSEIESCTKTVDNLQSGTEYKITLIFGQSGQRGFATAWTRPETGETVRVTTAQALYDNVFGATGEVRLLVAYNNGEEYDLSAALLDPETGGTKSLAVTSDLYIFGESSEEGKKPVITNVEFSLAGAASKIHLEDLALNGRKSAGATVSVASAPSISAVEFVNCDIYDYTKGIYSTAAGVTSNVGKVLFSGVYAHDINADGSAGGDFIDIRNGGLTSEVEVMNSTFYACARTFLRVSDNAKSNKVSVHNCTFNYVTATPTSSNNAGIFHVRETSETSEITCYNCLFMNMFNEKEDADGTGWIRIARNNATQSMAPACENNYYYRVGKVFLTTQAFVPQTGAQFDGSNWIELAADPCVNSDAGKLYLTDGIIAANQVGDPRWWNASEPVVIRETELKVVEETTVWDFTDKTKFDTESVAANTIIENIRIYAPAEIVMGQGITFANGAELNANNIPTSSALGFKAAGYGSVKVETAGGAYNASVHVVVGGDRITLPADGTEHKAVFGDLSGENDFYVLAGSAVTITKVTWTPGDAEAEDTKTAIDAPKVTLTPSSITEGNEDGVDVVVSWEAVENAAYYTVTFDDTAYGDKIYDLSCTLPASMFNKLAVGLYSVAVTAHPTDVSSKYKASEAAAVNLNVKEKPAAGAPVTLTWDFSTAEWQAAFEAAAPGAKGTNQADWTVSLDGLTYTSGTGNGKWDANGFIQPNGGGSTTSRVFSFTAPAGGTLKITAQSANSSETRDIVVLDSNGVEQTSGVLTQTELEFDVAAGEVYIYPKGGIRFYKFEFTYIGEAASEPAVWDFSSAEWQGEFAKYGASNTDIENWNLTFDGLTIVSTGKSKYNTTYFQWGGKGSTSDRYMKFEALSSGTLTVTTSNTGGSEDLTRMVTVNQNGVETSKAGGTASNVDPSVLTFDVTSGEVLIYCTGNALRFYKVEFDAGVKK